MALTFSIRPRWLAVAFFTLTVGFAALSAAQDSKTPEKELPAYKVDLKPYAGKIIISEEAFPKTMNAEFEKFLKDKFKKDSLYTLTADPKGTWTFNLMGFFGKDPGASDAAIVFYDKDNKESQKNLEPVQALDQKTTKGQKILSIPSISLGDGSGLVAGKTYIVRIAQLKGDKEISLAEAQIKLLAAPIAKDAQ